MNNTEHYHGLDRLRAWLMLAGVLSHAADVIGPEKWIYNSKHYYNETINQLIYITHLFRMETFFVLAGFFSCLVISRKGTDCFIKNRINRVLIPFLSSIAAITSFQIFFILETGIATEGEINLTRIISHLWFLQTLFMLSILLALLPIEKIKSKLKYIKKQTLAATLLIIAILPYGISQLSTKLFPSDINLQAAAEYYLADPIHYGLYFLLGYALYANKSLFSRAIKFNKPILLFTFVISAGILVYIRHLSIHDTEISIIVKAAKIPLKLLCALSASTLLISFFTERKYHKSATASFLVRSSIAIYLFHHPIVIVSAYYMDTAGYNSYTYFISICLVTYALSFAAFLFIDQFSVTRKLFGIPTPEPSTASAQKNLIYQPNHGSTQGDGYIYKNTEPLPPEAMKNAEGPPK